MTEDHITAAQARALSANGLMRSIRQRIKDAAENGARSIEIRDFCLTEEQINMAKVELERDGFTAVKFPGELVVSW